MEKFLHKSKNCAFVTKKNTKDFLAESAMDQDLSKLASDSKQKRNNDIKKNLPSNKKKERCGQTIIFNAPVYILGYSTYVGTKEGKGPLGKYFYKVAKDDKLNQKSFEYAEIKMLQESVEDAIKNAGKKPGEMDLLLAGDLLNQITTSSFVARQLAIPYIGVYSACSTMTASMSLAATFVSSGYYDNIACATASHFATAERQYRYPLEYGCQRPPYAQWTVTGAACAVLSGLGSGTKVTMAVLGKVVDFGINDLNNMGAAMAPVNAIVNPSTVECNQKAWTKRYSRLSV